jgi:uncharacterized membrane protein YcaP (DUF421 family)
MGALETVFGAMQHVTWWQEVLRALVVFVYGLLMLRCTGRRTFGRWSALDFVVSIIVGSSLSRALTGSAPFGGTLAAVAVLMVVHWILGRIVADSDSASALVEGRPIVLAQGGEPNQRVLASQLVSKSDLEEALRNVGIEHAPEARLIMLEPSGRITVLKKA